MRSAYLVLGVPGNASPEEIELAWTRASELYSPARLAAEDGAVDKFNDLKNAYAILRDPQSRAAHDRKLASAPPSQPAPRVHVVREEESPVRGLLKWGLVLVAALFLGGYYVSYRNAEARKAQALLELAEKQKAEREAEEKKLEAEKLEAQQARAKAAQEAEDRRFAAESRAAAIRATYERERSEQNALAQQRAAIAEQERQERAAALQQQRAAAEARMRVEQEKRRIRDACYQLYRRYDC